MIILQKWLKKKFTGISWKNKYIKLIFHCIDIPDWITRQVNSLGNIPKYSIRVRSNGVQGQFGGKIFANSGKLITQLLSKHTNLKPQSKILEIGCGCGRIAFGLANILENGNYIGMDVDKLVIAECKKNSIFKKKDFVFQHMDVHNYVYNTKGEISADSFQFSYPDKNADIIILISVFTHMLPEDVAHYINEISRMLHPGGYCFFSTFLMDYGHQGRMLDFPYNHSYYRLHQEINPEKAVGYYQNFLSDSFTKAGISLLKDPILGRWRPATTNDSSDGFSQDIMIFIKDIY